MNNLKKICVLGGGRIPFQPSGTVYKKMSNIDLVKLAINGVLEQTKIDKSEISSSHQPHQ